jgi:hypothetical protein
MFVQNTFLIQQIELRTSPFVGIKLLLGRVKRWFIFYNCIWLRPLVLDLSARDRIRGGKPRHGVKLSFLVDRDIGRLISWYEGPKIDSVKELSVRCISAALRESGIANHFSYVLNDYSIFR